MWHGRSFPGDTQQEERCSPTPPPRPLVSSPPFPGSCPAITWALRRVAPPHRLELVPVRSQPVRPMFSDSDPLLPPPPPGCDHPAFHHSAQRRGFRRRDKPLLYWLGQTPPSSGKPVTARVSGRADGSVPWSRGGP